MTPVEGGVFDLELEEEARAAQCPSLPADLWIHVFRHGSPCDWAGWAAVSNEVHCAIRTLRASCEALSVTSLRALCGPSEEALRASLSSLNKLTHLQLPGGHEPGSLLSDAQLVVLAEALVVLQVLELPRQRQLTNRGLRCAAPAFSASLRALDLTYCSLVGYSALVHLRQHCPDLATIRRLPAWLVGSTTTPEGERHTYYVDGSFEFDRDDESRGWVAQLRELTTSPTEPREVETRLVYVDDPDEVYGPQAHNGRVGVLIRDTCAPASSASARASARVSDAPSARELLVVQSHYVPEPPPAFPDVDAACLPALSETRHLRKVEGGVMITRLLLDMLPPDQHNPPAALLDQLSRFCDEHPVRRREYERRALRSMVDGRRHAQGERVASVLNLLASALSPPSASPTPSGSPGPAS